MFSFGLRVVCGVVSLVAVAGGSECTRESIVTGRKRYLAALSTGLARHAEAAIVGLEACLASDAGPASPPPLPSPGHPGHPHDRAAAEAYFYLGAANGLLRNHSAALRAYRLSNLLRPGGNPSATENMGAVYSSLKEWGKAALWYGRAAAMRPLQTGLHEAHAKMLFRAGQVSRARRVFADALAVAPSNPSLWYELGRQNELFGHDSDYARDVASNFSRAIAVSWAALAGGVGSTGDSNSRFTLVEQVGGPTMALTPGATRWSDHPDAVRLRRLGPVRGGAVDGLDGGKEVQLAEFLAPVEICGNDGVVYEASRRLVFLPAFREQVPLHRNLAALPPALHPPQPRVVDAAILLVQLFAVGYYHFLLELLPRLLLALEHAPGAQILLPSNAGELAGFMRASLAVLGIPLSRVVQYDLHSDPRLSGSCRITVRRLIQIDWVWPATTAARRPRPEAAHLPPPRALNILRSALASTHRNRTARIASHRNRTAGPPLVVWIRRATAPTRQTRNERQLLEMLRSMLPGAAELKIFSDVPKTPPFPDAIALFSRAKAVIGMHGAGLANAVFCPVGAHVVEFALPEAHAQYFRHVAASNGLHYHRVGLEGTGLYGQRSVAVPVGPAKDAFAAVVAALG